VNRHHVHSARTARLAVLVTATVLAGATFAQTVLDRNAQIGGGRVNPSQASPVMARQLYTVNRETGELRYNRTNAFRDRAYSTYDRYTVDRTKYFEGQAGGLNTAATTNRRLVTPTVQTSNPLASSYGNPQRLSRPTGPTMSRPMYAGHRSSAPRTAGMRSPTYHAASSRQPSTRISTRTLRR
jgi:hypothetical protein